MSRQTCPPPTCSTSPARQWEWTWIPASPGTLEGRGEGVVRGYKYCFVFQAEDILPTLNELVNPYDQPLTEEDLDLPQAEYYWNGTVID